MSKLSIKLTAIAVAASAAFTAFGAAVSPEDAKSAVAGFVKQRAALDGAITASPSDVQAYSGADGVGTYYVVSLEGGGYVVTSGDTSLRPVIAYSKGGTWDPNPANPAVALVSGDVAALSAALASGAEGIDAEANAAKWAELIAASTSRTRLLSASTSDVSDIRVAPLLTSRWNQGDVTGKSGSTLHCYNYYTPNHYVCGCTATAMAQLMYYHRYPTAKVTAKHNYYDTVYFSTDSEDKEGWNISEGYCTSKGATKTAWSPAFGGPYNWDKMIDIPNGNATVENCQAIGQLTRDAGLTVFSGYNKDGGGETSGYAGTDASALIDTFGYADAVRTGYKESAILASLDAKLPVLCGLSKGSSGHAVVIDGYGYGSGNTLYLHFNMGWGYAPDDWWYAPPEVYSFTSIASCVCNIRPPSMGEKGRSIISGRILSGSGSTISGATVTASNDTFNTSVTTDSKGIYALILPAGTYDITATSSGQKATTGRTLLASSQTTWNSSGWQWGSNNNINGVDLIVYTEVSTKPTISSVKNSGSDTYTVTLSAASGATIYYTTDGSVPDELSAVYTGPFVVTDSTLVRARALESGKRLSDDAAATGGNSVVNPWPAGTTYEHVDHPSTLWGRISYGASRSAMTDFSWKNIKVRRYTPKGEGDISNLYGENTDWEKSNLQKSQLRYDGWIHVDAAKAGNWQVIQKFDDYFALYIDNVNVITNKTYTEANTNYIDVAQGWHRFTIVCGDTDGGQGSMLDVNGTKVPFSVTVNGSTYAFSEANFPQGYGASKVTLTADADWTALDVIDLPGGTVIDLNGHNLTVKDFVGADYVGGVIANSSATASTLTFTGGSSTPKAVSGGLVKGVGTSIIVENTTSPDTLVMPKIVSHRGESADRPENTMAAYRLGFERGVDGVECDVFATSDGVVVLAHDNPPKTSSLNIYTSTWDELKDITVGNFGSWTSTEWASETLPRIEDYLALLASNNTTKCVIELKGNGENNLVANVVAAVRAQPLATKDRIVFIAFTHSLIRDIREELPDYEAWLLLGGRSTPYTGSEMLALIEQYNATGVDIEYGTVGTVADVKAVTDEGYAFGTWTCDDAAKNLELAQKGVQYTTTNKGGYMLTTLPALIEAYNEENKVVTNVFPAGLTRLDVGAYVQDGLLLHVDGIRNAGADQPHSTTATGWKDLVQGDLATFKKSSDSSAVSSVNWADDGYNFEGASYAQVGHSLTIPATASVQLVGDMDTDTLQSVFSSSSWIKYPAPIGSTDTGDGFVLFWHCGDKNLCMKINGSKFSKNISEGVWDGQYATYLNDGDVAALFQESIIFPSQTNAWNVTSTTRTVTIGASNGGNHADHNGYEARSLTGKIQAVRIYNRALTTDELRKNRIIDNARFKDIAAEWCVLVESNRPGVDGTEECGAYYVNGSHTFTAPAAKTVGGLDYELTGYVLERYNRTSKSWEQVAVSDGASYTYTSGESSAGVRITWQWDVDSDLYTSAADFDVDEYIQDGLVAHFDGIRNAGAGVPHNSSATVWKNLVDGGTDADLLDFDNASSAGTWTSDGLGFDFTASGYARLQSALALTQNFTMQFATDIDLSSGSAQYASLVHNADSTDYGVYRDGYSNSSSKILNVKMPFSNDKSDNIRPHIDTWEGQYATIMYADSYRYIFQGTTLPTASPEMLSRTASTPAAYRWSWAGNPVKNNNNLKGIYYSVRFYNRTLAEAEIAHNRMIDEIRYRGKFADYANVTIASDTEGWDSDITGPCYTKTSYTFNAPATKTVGGKQCKCIGYLLEHYDSSTSTWVSDGVQEGTSYTFTNTGDGTRVRVTWQTEQEDTTGPYFKFDFSSGSLSLSGWGAENVGSGLSGATYNAIQGPRGANTAVYPSGQHWAEIAPNSELLHADWTWAMTIRPGDVEGGTILGLGRAPTGGKTIGVCSSSDKSKIYIRIISRPSEYTTESSIELTGLGDVTDGFHSLVIAHQNDAANPGKGTLYFYWDGQYKGSFKMTSSCTFNGSSKPGMQFSTMPSANNGTYGGYTYVGTSNNSAYGYYDVRLYTNKFEAVDALAYDRETRPALLHRWSFNNGDLTDSGIGGMTSSTTGVTFTEGKLVTTQGGKQTSYVDLGSNVIPSALGDTPFTIETWVTPQSVDGYKACFSLGNGQSDKGIQVVYRDGTAPFVTAPGSSGVSSVSKNNTTTGNNRSFGNRQLTLGTKYHITFTVTPKGDGDGAKATLYIHDSDGNPFVTGWLIYTGWTTALLNQTHFYLNENQWGNGATKAEFDEVRVWRCALSEEQILKSIAAGPDTLPDFTTNSDYDSGLTLIGAGEPDVGSYVQDGIMLHLDGIRNAGANQPHSKTATGWTDLVQGDSATFKKSSDSTAVDSVNWADDGYNFDGASYALVGHKLNIPNTMTVQLVSDINTQDLIDSYTNNKIMYPAPIGCTDTGDNFVMYWHYNQKKLNIKINSNLGRYIENGEWLGDYETYWNNGGTGALFQETIPSASQKNSFNQSANRTVTVGASNGGTCGDLNGYEGRSLTGKIQAVRIYNRALTDAELRKNRMIDDLRFKGIAADWTVLVRSNIDGLEGNEASGLYYVNGNYTFTCPESATVGDVTYNLSGYAVERYNKVSGEWDVIDVCSGNSYAYTSTLESGAVRLTWVWEELDISNVYFGYDFMSGRPIFMPSTFCTAEPSEDLNYGWVSVPGPDGLSTAVHPSWKGTFASGGTQLSGDWTLAMSLKPGNIEKGVLLSLGGEAKQVAFCSSATNDTMYAVVSMAKQINASVTLTNIVNTSGSFHSIVAVHDSATHQISFYCDGVECAPKLDAGTAAFANGFQFGEMYGGNAEGYSSTMSIADVAFRDLRFFNRKISAEELAEYSTLFPAAASAVIGLDDYYFRHNFESGKLVVQGNGYVEGTNAMAGTGTEVTPGQNQDKATFPAYAGEGSIDGGLNRDWTVAMSVRPSVSMDHGVLFSLGGTADPSSKGFAVCTSMTLGKLWFLNPQRYGSGSGKNTQAGNNLALTDLGDTATKFHTLVLAYSRNQRNAGNWQDSQSAVGVCRIYWDGKYMGEMNTSDGPRLPICNGIKYGAIFGGNPAGDGNDSQPSYQTLSDVSCGVAFQDLRFYTNVWTSVEAANYAAAYPVPNDDDPPRELTWSNTMGDGSFDNVANWTPAYLPRSVDSVTVNVTGASTITATNNHVVSSLVLTGTGPVAFAFTGNGNLNAGSFEVPSGMTVTLPKVCFGDGGLKGYGNVILDPGAGNTITMSKSNNEFWGGVTIASGTVKFGDMRSFGGRVDNNENRAFPIIRVKGGATLDLNAATCGDYVGEINRAILEAGATLKSTGNSGAGLTSLILEGDATVDTSSGLVVLSYAYDSGRPMPPYINLNNYTLTKTGNGEFYVSSLCIDGTGTLDVQAGHVCMCDSGYYDVTPTNTFANGTLRVASGAVFQLHERHGHPVRFLVKNLELDGTIQNRGGDSNELIVTGSITGTGTTPYLTLAGGVEGGAIKPTVEGYLTVSNFVNEVVVVDTSHLPMSAAVVQLLKVGEASNLPTADNIVIRDRPNGWRKILTDDGLGYDLRRGGFYLRLR